MVGFSGNARGALANQVKGLLVQAKSADEVHIFPPRTTEETRASVRGPARGIYLMVTRGSRPYLDDS